MCIIIKWLLYHTFIGIVYNLAHDTLIIYFGYVILMGTVSSLTVLHAVFQTLTSSIY